jgi:hypothetical protein
LIYSILLEIKLLRIDRHFKLIKLLRGVDALHMACICVAEIVKKKNPTIILLLAVVKYSLKLAQVLENCFGFDCNPYEGIKTSNLGLKSKSSNIYCMTNA